MIYYWLDRHCRFSFIPDGWWLIESSNNLNEDYFTTTQDQNMFSRECKDLTDFIDQVVERKSNLGSEFRRIIWRPSSFSVTRTKPESLRIHCSLACWWSWRVYSCAVDRGKNEQVDWHLEEIGRLVRWIGFTQDENGGIWLWVHQEVILRIFGFFCRSHDKRQGESKPSRSITKYTSPWKLSWYTASLFLLWLTHPSLIYKTCRNLLQ